MSGEGTGYAGVPPAPLLNFFPIPWERLSEECRVKRNRKGLLRQANQESRKRRQERKWEDDDFYASDEDEFLDRTGNIEKKRKNRDNFQLLPDRNKSCFFCQAL